MTEFFDPAVSQKIETCFNAIDRKTTLIRTHQNDIRKLVEELRYLVFFGEESEEPKEVKT